MPYVTDLKEPKLARDIMARKLITVRPEDDVAVGVQALLRNRISGMPVVDGEGRYLGVFSEKSCMKVLTQTAERIEKSWRKAPLAKNFMQTKLLRLSPRQEACEAIGLLLANHVSGAPVTEPDASFLGVFSEKSSMSVLLQTAYDGAPSSEVRAFMNTEQGRIIDEETDLFAAAMTFINTHYRRLEVLRGGKVVGQISRRDVLRSSQILETIIRHHAEQAEPARQPGNESMVLLRAHEQLPSTSVKAFMDEDARTIGEEEGLLSMAQIFLNTPYRRLPVLRAGRVVGQVSRRDVLCAIYELTEPLQPQEEPVGLYLSACRDRSEMPCT
jgi:predicted transcriptional regulator